MLLVQGGNLATPLSIAVGSAKTGKYVKQPIHTLVYSMRNKLMNIMSRYLCATLTYTGVLTRDCIKRTLVRVGSRAVVSHVLHKTSLNWVKRLSPNCFLQQCKKKQDQATPIFYKILLIAYYLKPLLEQTRWASFSRVLLKHKWMR